MTRTRERRDCQRNERRTRMAAQRVVSIDELMTTWSQSVSVLPPCRDNPRLTATRGERAMAHQLRDAPARAVRMAAEKARKGARHEALLSKVHNAQVQVMGQLATVTRI